MAKFIQIVALTMCVATVVALPRQYRYYPPTPIDSRFPGWTWTSQELLALPSQNDPANIVRVAPPAGFVRPHHVSRRSVPIRFIPSAQFAYLNDDSLVEYQR